jgi:psiF repeat.
LSTLRNEAASIGAATRRTLHEDVACPVVDGRFAALLPGFRRHCPTEQNDYLQCRRYRKSLKGDERKAFMSTCLKAAPAADAAKPMTPQQEKMKTCNATATTQALTGDARKTFMSECLKKK